MKSKLFISGVLIFVLSLTSSCTNDDYEIPQDNYRELKVVPKYPLNNLNENANMQYTQDTIESTVNREINVTSGAFGDPSNPRPPRKD